MGAWLISSPHRVTEPWRFLQAGDAIDELALAVAVDTGDADDLSGADIERDIVHSIFLVKLRVYTKVLHGQDDVPRLGLTF